MFYKDTKITDEIKKNVFIFCYLDQYGDIFQFTFLRRYDILLLVW